MGEIVGAAVVCHQPGVMAPKPIRERMGGGVDTSMVEGFGKLRQAIDAVGGDTLVIFDTHWFTTVEHIVAGRARFEGVYTSEELPNLIRDHPYNFPGAPDLAAAAEADNLLDFGAVVGDAGVRIEGRVVPLASGGMSHTFRPLDVVRQHVAYT